MLTDFAIGVSPKRVVPFVWLFGFLFVTYWSLLLLFDLLLSYYLAKSSFFATDWFLGSFSIFLRHDASDLLRYWNAIDYLRVSDLQVC
jgi:hypothetical protein